MIKKRKSIIAAILCVLIVLSSVPLYADTSVTGVSLNKTNISIDIGVTEQLAAAVSPTDATNQEVIWSSSDGEVATVDANGEVTGISEGTATVTATTEDGGYTADCAVEVTPEPEIIAVTGVSLDETSTTLTTGGIQQLIATITPVDATNQEVIWSSSNGEVATVGTNGEITAVGEGIAIVTATTEDGGYTADCAIEVTPEPEIIAVTGVSLDETSTTLATGDTQQLIATITPADATNQEVIWSSSNEEVATVDTNGEITAVGEGIATVTATTEDGGYTADCAVEVTAEPEIIAVTGVSLDETSSTLEIGGTQQLIATITPVDATNQEVIWSSSDEEVATVDINGEVTAIGEGTAAITATTADGGYTALCSVLVTAQANITAEPTHTTITLSWDAVNEAIGYDVEADGVVIDAGSSTSYQHSGLNPDSQHICRVRARTVGGAGEWSDAVSADTLAPIAAQITIDGNDSDWAGIAPAAQGEESTIDLSAVQDNNKLYMLIRGTNIGDWNAFYIDSDNNSATGRHNTNWPNCGADYLLEDSSILQRVDDAWVYVGSAAISRNSNIVEVAVDLSQIGRTEPGEMRLSYDREDDNCAPARGSQTAMVDMIITGVVPTSTIPTNITAEPTHTTVTLTWDAVNEAIGYDVEADGVVIDAGSSTSYKHSGLEPDSEHTYRVRARTAGGAGEWSDAVSADTLAPIAAQITIDGNDSDWAGIAPAAQGEEATIDLSAAQGNNKLYMLVRGTNIGNYNAFYIDSDNNSQTGRHNSNWPNCGAEYLVEDDSLWQRVNDSWVYVGNAVISRNSNTVEAAVYLNQIGRTEPGEMRLSYDRDDDHCAPARGSQTAMIDIIITGVVPTSDIPENITTEPTHTTVTLSWDAVNGATGYDVEADGTVIDAGSSTGYKHSGLEPDSEHTYRVRAKTAGGAGEWSDYLNADTLAPIAAQITIDGNESDWAGIAPAAQGEEATIDLSAVQDNNKLYMLIRGTNIGDYSAFYIDSDNNSQTGRHNSNWPNCGAEYLVEDDSLWQWVDNGWVYAGNLVVVENSNIVEVAIDLSWIGRTEPGEMRLSYDRDDDHCAPARGSQTAMIDIIITGVPPVHVIGISLNKTNTTLGVGSTETLVATISPEEATNKNVTWSSSDQAVAAVDSTGLVTAIAAGTATITATTVDGGFIATCAVEVTAIPITSINLNESNINLKAGRSQTLIASILPENASNKTLLWTSSNEAAAIVDSTGKITGIDAGEAIITASSLDQLVSAQCNVQVELYGNTFNENFSTIDYQAVETTGDWINGSIYRDGEVYLIDKNILQSKAIKFAESFSKIKVRIICATPAGTDYAFYLSTNGTDWNQINKECLDGTVKIDLQSPTDVIYWKSVLIGTGSESPTISSVTFTKVNSVDYEYNDQNQLERIRFSNGKELEYQYDDNGNLIQIIPIE